MALEERGFMEDNPTAPPPAPDPDPEGNCHNKKNLDQSWQESVMGESTAMSKNSYYSYKYQGSHSKEQNRKMIAISGLIVLVMMIGIGVGISSGEDTDIFAGEPGIALGGTYRLNSYDTNFDAYLSSLDVPKLVIRLIKVSKEMIKVEEPSGSNPNWTVTMETEYTVHKVTFRLNEDFHVPWEKGGRISHFCTRPEQFIIMCTTKEETKGWNLKTRMIFSDAGLIDEKTNLNAMISTNKTYVRLKEDGTEHIAEDEAGLIDNTETATPPMDEEDWFVWE